MACSEYQHSFTSVIVALGICTRSNALCLRIVNRSQLRGDELALLTPVNTTERPNSNVHDVHFGRALHTTYPPSELGHITGMRPRTRLRDSTSNPGASTINKVGGIKRRFTDRP